jgi:hypothetical protein
VPTGALQFQELLSEPAQDIARSALPEDPAVLQFTVEGPAFPAAPRVYVALTDAIRRGERVAQPVPVEVQRDRNAEQAQHHERAGVGPNYGARAAEPGPFTPSFSGDSGPSPAKVLAS